MMDASALQAVPERSEDGRHQLKADSTNANSLASELTVLASGIVRRLFIGVTEVVHIASASQQDVDQLNLLIPSSACQRMWSAHSHQPQPSRSNPGE